jgi:hypothetical protein
VKQTTVCVELELVCVQKYVFYAYVAFEFCVQVKLEIVYFQTFIRFKLFIQQSIFRPDGFKNRFFFELSKNDCSKFKPMSSVCIQIFPTLIYYLRPYYMGFCEPHFINSSLSNLEFKFGRRLNPSPFKITFTCL